MQGMSVLPDLVGIRDAENDEVRTALLVQLYE